MTIPKYRAWHKQLKKMMPVLEINLDPEFGGVFVWGKAYYDADTGEHEADKDFWPWDDIELMQWTPLKDKHNTEIYQSDVLELYCLGWGGPYKDRAVVVWEGFGWYFRFADGRLQPMEQKWQSECEVIGNSYEHPDQLQQQSPH